MANDRNLPVELKDRESFSKKEFVSAMATAYAMTRPQIAYDLQKRVDSGGLIHVGWNKYTVKRDKKLYLHSYSDQAEDVVEKIKENYVDLDFQIFELIQLNDFMNHQMVHNTIFVAVENELQDFVYNTMRQEYPGRVMLRPSVDEYYKYLIDDEIVVLRLPTESPKGIDTPWKSRLEKILVDVCTDKLVGGIVPDNEKKLIIEGAFNGYLLDVDAMYRYAKRKGAVEKFKRAMEKYEGETR